jgi:hypothetical protein
MDERRTVHLVLYCAGRNRSSVGVAGRAVFDVDGQIPGGRPGMTGAT